MSTQVAPKAKVESKAVKVSARKSFWPYLYWQLAALCVVEIVLAFAGIGEEEIFKLDNELGTAHMTNKQVTWRSEGYARSYFDGDGMREPGLTVVKPGGTYRIALLGDSMVEALQVPIENTFGQILQRRLSQNLKRPVQILNFGASGYSTAQECLQLKKQVLKYKPDLVLLFYNSRDIFENWSAPDQTITNVRPSALDLTGHDLTFDFAPIRKWMRTPKARLFRAFEWVRENSRIWGVISAAQTEWSFASPFYKGLMAFMDNPADFLKTHSAKDLFLALLPQQMSTPSFSVAKFEGEDTAAANGAVKEELISAAPNRVLANGASRLNEEVKMKTTTYIAGKATIAEDPAESQKEAKIQAGRQNYLSLIERTEGSLFNDMRADCQKIGAKFAVAVLPVRSALCPAQNMETQFEGIDYNREIQIVRKLCQKSGIPFFDDEAPAQNLSQDQSPTLFYSVHLTPKGHKFVADTVSDFVLDQVKGAP